MTVFRIFCFEYRHFKRSLPKVISYLVFLLACLYSINNGYELQQRQQRTIQNIQNAQSEEIIKVTDWYQSGKKGPADRDWVDVHQPYWALQYTPTSVFKQPSSLLPLGIGQAEQFGYYKEVNFWSATFDNDMVEELANPERLVGGTIDFSFMVIYLLPLLLIILTYNVGGLERDAQFDRLISIQFGSPAKWLTIRFSFYALLLICTVVVLSLSVAGINAGVFASEKALWSLIRLACGYVAFFSFLFLMILFLSSSSSQTAFSMIGFWLLFCLIIPGSVHQVANMTVPVNYMIDYLDVVRKDTYAMFSESTETQSTLLFQVYPTLLDIKVGLESETSNQYVRRSLSAIINDMNKEAAQHIEDRSELKNQFIRSSYWYNPVSFVQNRWNSYTATDYYAYQAYRERIQHRIDAKLEQLVYDTWNQTTVDQQIYEQYLQAFN